MFAAFPEWSPPCFSGFYLALFLILVALIVRGIGLEYRSKRDDLAWRQASIRRSSSDRPSRLCSGRRLRQHRRRRPHRQHRNFTGDLLTLLDPFGCSAAWFELIARS